MRCPAAPISLPVALRNAHGRYATYLNDRHGASRHVWQGRYFSRSLHARHLWATLRYLEHNPVRAGSVDRPQAHGMVYH